MINEDNVTSGFVDAEVVLSVVGAFSRDRLLNARRDAILTMTKKRLEADYGKLFGGKLTLVWEFDGDR